MFSSVGAFDIVTAAIAGVFLFALYTVFQIPGYYKYGSIKGRVFMYIPVAGFLVTLLLLSKMPAIGNSIISVVESSPILLVFLAVFAIVVAQKNYLCHSLHIPPQAFIIRYTALFSNVDSGYFSRISTLFSITFQQNGVVMVYQTVLYQPDIFRSCRSDDPGKSTSFAICSAAWS